MLLDYDEVEGCVAQTLYITLVNSLSHRHGNTTHVINHSPFFDVEYLTRTI